MKCISAENAPLLNKQVNTFFNQEKTVMITIIFHFEIKMYHLESTYICLV